MTAGGLWPYATREGIMAYGLFNMDGWIIWSQGMWSVLIWDGFGLTRFEMARIKSRACFKLYAGNKKYFFQTQVSYL